jgi:4'-phosphopantetheinyl transferase EntD
MKSFPRQPQSEIHSDDPLFDAMSAMATRVHSELLVGCRRITPEDERALTINEAAPLSRAIPEVRCATGAGRIVARELLRSLNAPIPEDIVRLASGAPAWPQGYTGSISHDAQFAVAAVVRKEKLPAVGIDIEPPLPLPAQLLEMVATPAEQLQLDGNLLLARLLFSVKEAVYKATNPCDGIYLDHHDIEVCLATQTARTSTGLDLVFEAILAPRIVVIAICQSFTNNCRIAST